MCHFKRDKIKIFPRGAPRECFSGPRCGFRRPCNLVQHASAGLTAACCGAYVQACSWWCQSVWRLCQWSLRSSSLVSTTPPRRCLTACAWLSSVTSRECFECPRPTVSPPVRQRCPLHPRTPPRAVTLRRRRPMAAPNSPQILALLLALTLLIRRRIMSWD